MNALAPASNPNAPRWPALIPIVIIGVPVLLKLAHVEGIDVLAVEPDLHPQPAVAGGKR